MRNVLMIFYNVSNDIIIIQPLYNVAFPSKGKSLWHNMTWCCTSYQLFNKFQVDRQTVTSMALLLSSVSVYNFLPLFLAVNTIYLITNGTLILEK